MNKRIFQIVTLAFFVILLSVTLCACSLFGSGSGNGNTNGDSNKKLSGIFPTAATPKWNSTAHGEIFEYTEEIDDETGAKKVTITGLKKKTEKQVVIPEGVTAIAAGAFSKCTGVISLTIPDTMTSIGNYAFSGCIGLIGVSLGEKVANIGYAAFEDCYKLVEVYNKSSLCIMERSSDYGGIGYYAKNVYSTAKGTKLDVDGSNYVIYKDGEKKILMGYSGTETELNLPDEVTDIANYAFAYNDNVTSVTIGNNVERTGDRAFAECTALKNIFFGGKITRISYGEFAGCSALTSLVIPETVTSIGRYAFSECTSLTNVTVGSKVNKIENSAFSNCYRLVEVYNKSALDIKVKTDNESGDGVFDDDGYDEYGGIEIRLKNVYKKSGESKLTTDGKGFIVYADGLEKTIVNYIGNDANPTLPLEIAKINDYAFYDCDQITEIKISDNVTSIGENAFSYCDGLKKVTISDVVTNIDSRAFDMCSVESAILPASAIRAVVNSQIKEIVITSGETIPNGAFSDCEELIKVTLPDSVTSISDYAFDKCSGLTSITIPDSVTSIGDYAFQKCSGLKSIIIPDGVTIIGEGAFLNCTSVTSIIVPESVTSIGETAFFCFDIQGGKDVVLKGIYYKGTEEKWNEIDKGRFYYIVAGITYVYSKEYPLKEGNYWHYVDGEITAWEKVHVHSYGEWEEKTPATCMTDKVEHRVCKSCGNEETRTVEDTALGHELKRYEAQEPTCTEVGWDEYETCTRSGCDYTTYVEKPALGHVLEEHEAQEPTCTEVGWDEYEACTRSGCDYTTKEEKPSLGHDYDENDICKTCGEEKQTSESSFVFEYDERQDGYIVIEYVGNEADVIIPKRYNDGTNGVKEIKAIANRVFNNKIELISVKILDNVTSIGEYAFAECNGLTSIIIPDSVTIIGENAFLGTSNLTSVYYKGSEKQWDRLDTTNTGLNEKTVYFYSETTPTESGNYWHSVDGKVETHFHIYSEWEEIIPATCTTDKVERRVCESCGNEEMRTVEDTALGHALEEHEAQNPTCTEIGWDAYETCTRSGCEYTTYEEELALGHELETYEVKEPTCAEVGWEAYERCTRSGCDYTTYVEKPALGHVLEEHEAQEPTCTEVGWEAYERCTHSGCEYTTYVEKSALGHELETYEAKEPTCTEIGWNAYERCMRSGCEHNTYEEKPALGHDYDENDICKTCGEERLTDVSSFTFKYDEEQNCYVVIGYNGTDEHVVIPKKYNDNVKGKRSVKAIGARAFIGKTELLSVKVVGDMTSIGDYAFYGCSGLTRVIIGEKITDIGECAFGECTGLTNITIPDGVTNIHDSAFSSCNLESATIPTAAIKAIQSSRVRKIILTNGDKIVDNAFMQYDSLTEIEIPDTVTSIGQNAFYKCTGLVSITIPDNVASIGKNAFDGCSGLTTVNWNAIACESAGASFQYIFINCNMLATINIGEKVTSIPALAFYACSGLTSITIPESVTSIGENAFGGCSELTTINWNAIECTKAGSFDNTVFKNCTQLITVNIGDEVKIIPSYTFYNCDKLTSITIPESVTSIGENAFGWCSRLTIVNWNAIACTNAGSLNNPVFKNCTRLITVNIGDKVKIIPSYTFYNCAKLTNITIPESVASIGKNVFSSCDSLAEIRYNGTMEQWKGITNGDDIGLDDGVKIYCTDGIIVIGNDSEETNGDEAAGE